MNKENCLSHVYILYVSILIILLLTLHIFNKPLTTGLQDLMDDLRRRHLKACSDPPGSGETSCTRYFDER